MSVRPTVYLAGPAMLLPAHAAILRHLKEACAKHGLDGVAPEGYAAATLAGLAPADRARAIRDANAAKIRACDLVIACISPFRGPGAEAGTAWEMGYAEALGKPVVPWCEDPRPYIERLVNDRDADGRVWCKQHGMLVEDYGLWDVLMLAAGAIAVQPDFDHAVRAAQAICGQRAAPGMAVH